MGKNMDSFTDFYDLLGVPADADERQIRRAFHSQSRLYHPDKNPDQTEATKERMKLLNRAKETLLDPTSRCTYDQERRWQQEEEKFGNHDVDNMYRKMRGYPYQMRDNRCRAGEGRGRNLLLVLLLLYRRNNTILSNIRDSFVFLAITSILDFMTELYDC